MDTFLQIPKSDPPYFGMYDGICHSRFRSDHFCSFGRKHRGDWGSKNDRSNPAPTFSTRHEPAFSTGRHNGLNGTAEADIVGSALHRTRV